MKSKETLPLFHKCVNILFKFSLFVMLNNTMLTCANNFLIVSSLVIDELGGTKEVAAICGVRVSAVNNWLNRGLPRGMRLFLKEKYPTLKAWALEEKEAENV